MNKVVTFLRAAKNLDRERFQAAVLDMATSSRNDTAAAHALTVNLVQLPPANLPYRPPSDPTAGAVPEYDVILEAWTLGPARAVVEGFKRALPMPYATCHSYAVTETIIYERLAFPRGRPSSGIKLIGRLMFHADLPDTAAKRSWVLHAPLAARVHTGSARYVQHWVDAPLDPACPPARGLPLMHFPTDEDFFQRFVDSPRGMEEILQDTSHFVSSGPRFYTTEYIIRAPSKD
jgi:hypothetical protein